MDNATEQQIIERLARIEAKLERIEALEKSMIRQNERIGKLEVIEYQRHGGLAVMMALWTGAGVIGAAVAKFWPFE